MTKRAVPDWLTKWEYAHRGLHGNGVPENSLQAARLAIEAGMGIECDIQRSFDDQPMVFHDWDLKRLIGTDGDTKAHNATDLQQMCFKDNDERIATLADFLSLIDGKVTLLIELKSKPTYDVIASCEAVWSDLSGYDGDHAVMSFDPRVARWFRKHSPQTCVGLVMREDEHGYTQTQDVRDTAFAIAQPDFLAYHVAALPNPWVQSLRAGGLPVLTWTVNSVETRGKALAYADALIAEGGGLA